MFSSVIPKENNEISIFKFVDDTKALKLLHYKYLDLKVLVWSSIEVEWSKSARKLCPEDDTDGGSLL